MASKRGGSSNAGWGAVGIFLALMGLAGTGHVPQIEDLADAFKNPPVKIPDSIASNNPGQNGSNSPSGASVSPSGAISGVNPSGGASMNAAARSDALRALESIPSSGAGPTAPYKRSEFGQAWSDNTSAPGGHNGCDTRNDVLAKSLVNVTFRAGSRCVVESGTLPYDPYTGATNVAWTKAKAASLQVDHVVPLKWAWEHGASSWPQDKRDAYANDMDVVLLLADGPQNGLKGASGPSGWMVPKNPAYRCTYAAKYTSIVQRYGLWLPSADASVLKKTLDGCRG